jgi:hypothetical protein
MLCINLKIIKVLKPSNQTLKLLITMGILQHLVLYIYLNNTNRNILLYHILLLIYIECLTFTNLSISSLTLIYSLNYTYIIYIEMELHTDVTLELPFHPDSVIQIGRQPS